MLMSTTLRLSLPPFPRSLAQNGAFPREPVFSQLNLASPNAHRHFLSPLSCWPDVDRRRRAPLTMSAYDRPTINVAAKQFEVRELNDESDFEALLSNDGRFSVCGFGSLLSGNRIDIVYLISVKWFCFLRLMVLWVGLERSARSTFPELSNFRLARLNGFRRVFAHVTPIFFERGIAKPETKVFPFFFFFFRIKDLFASRENEHGSENPLQSFSLYIQAFQFFLFFPPRSII